MDVKVINGPIPQTEIDAYIKHVIEKNPKREILWLEITIDGEFVDFRYELKPVPFERVRRITGYLVGDLNRFNNAKRAEVRDRVKHGV